MEVIAKTEHKDIATVYLAEMSDGRKTEFVESVQPPLPRNKKWVIIVSSLCGCPVNCQICDAGGYYRGRLTKDEILAQIDYMVTRRFPDRKIPVDKFKVQFARIGEPAFNANVLEVLSELPSKYDAPGLIACVSTIAPSGTDDFFRDLLDVKRTHYHKKFQLQFSIHTTDRRKRDWLIPVKKWELARIAEYGSAFYEDGDRKIALNFALAAGMPVDPDVLIKYFKPDNFLIKITPVNPTYKAIANEITSYMLPGIENYEVADTLRNAGYEVLLSVGELEENQIGSNCGQYLLKHMTEKNSLKSAYTYAVSDLRPKNTGGS